MNLLVRALRASHEGTLPEAIDPGIIRRILLVELTRLGDVVSMLSTVPLIRRHFPNATIHILVDEEYEPLFEAFTLDVATIPIRRSRSLRGLIGALMAARLLNVELACSMSPSRRNAAVALGCGSKGVIGYLDGEGSSTSFLVGAKLEGFGVRIPEGQAYRHDSTHRRSLLVCSVLGIPPRPVTLELSDGRLEQGFDTVRSRHRLPDSNFVVIHPFAGWKYREWPLERYVALARELMARHDYEVVFIGGKSDRRGIQRIQDMIGGEKCPTFVAESVFDAAAVLNKASLFIGNDSGPLHLAAALGVRTLGLFGPAGPHLTAPVSTYGITLYRQLECSPCDQRGCVRPDDYCMKHISVAEVGDTVRGMLSSVRRRPDRAWMV